ncbi:O-antigen ligase family protein [Nitrosomonas supralitoralis]|uniref:Ligase n=1 Tax=Nitrosomonas supralitoralis TaxID=2116706 RepID=A0A2P7NRW0_9PROT|nr:O-antigen ligase family protein [Nitrosomonas supralitoralis]PSJ16192.1 ligase [Nitrosomonas supralitoralis]
MHNKPADSITSLQDDYAWRDVIAKLVLFFFGLALLHKGFNFYIVAYALPIIWILDGGLNRIRYSIQEPLVVAILIFCGALALGILWSDNPALGIKVWQKYWAFLFFIPYLSLLSNQRLPWAIGGLLMGFLIILLAGLYQWIVMQEQGVPFLKLSHTGFSLILGIGVIVSLYFAATSSHRKTSILLWFFMFFLLFIQFNQYSRTALLATIFTAMLLILLLYKKEIQTLIVAMVVLIFVGGVFAVLSSTLSERMIHAQTDIESSLQGNYSTSLGYRLAMWDVGLHSIAQHPYFGYGTGMAASHFDKTIETYKGGIYKDLPDFVKTYHYHNDLIEIGMHIGAIGLITYTLLLWSWFKSMKEHQLGILGIAFVCYVFLAGLTETLVYYRATLYFILAVTAISIAKKKTELSCHNRASYRSQLQESRFNA